MSPTKKGPKGSQQEQLMYEELGKTLVGGSLSQIATYSDLFTKTRDAIFLLSLKNLRVLECNPSVGKLLGRSPEEIQGKYFKDLLDPKEVQAIQKAFEETRSQNIAPEPFDIHMVSQQKEKIILEVTLSRLKLADYAEVLQVIGRDVRELRKAQESLRKMNQKLEALSITDEMTGLNNFRHFKNELQKVHLESERYQRSYSIIFCDIDHFKNYNDQNGHPAGDRALIQVAELIHKECRATDFSARYGGEEFVILCPGLDSPAVHPLAERLRNAVESTSFEYGMNQPGGRVTVSVGVASYPKNGQSSEQVLQAADEALYQSKQSGRNQVTVSALKAAKKPTENAA